MKNGAYAEAQGFWLQMPPGVQTLALPVRLRMQDQQLLIASADRITVRFLLAQAAKHKVK